MSAVEEAQHRVEKARDRVNHTRKRRQYGLATLAEVKEAEADYREAVVALRDAEEVESR